MLKIRAHYFLADKILNHLKLFFKIPIQEVIKFWLEEKDVDGLRVDALGFLFENQNFLDEPIKQGTNLLVKT